MNTRRLLVLLLVAVIVLPAAIPASASSPDAFVRVKIKDSHFRPRDLIVQVGDSVRWRNLGEQPHTTTSTTGDWDSGIMDPGETFDFTFDQAGTFIYTCTIHNFRARVVAEGLR